MRHYCVLAQNLVAKKNNGEPISVKDFWKKHRATIPDLAALARSFYVRMAFT